MEITRMIFTSKRRVSPEKLFVAAMVMSCLVVIYF